jgi:hypothetical protein
VLELRQGRDLVRLELLPNPVSSCRRESGLARDSVVGVGAGLAAGVGSGSSGPAASDNAYTVNLGKEFSAWRVLRFGTAASVTAKPG